jgi:hypothetical protein
MKLTTVTNVSVDGVMQGLGGPDEDRRGGFERGGWALPLFDDEAETFLGQVYQRADAFLFGPPDLRDLRRLMGNRILGGKPGQQPHRSGAEHAAQVRRIDHAHRPAMGGHDRPLR